MRLHCVLFGCQDNPGGQCVRCGATLYDGDFLYGKLTPVLHWWRKARVEIAYFLVPPVCEICKQPLKREDRVWGVCERPECREHITLPF
jgi:hypothetical protein